MIKILFFFIISLSVYGSSDFDQYFSHFKRISSFKADFVQNKYIKSIGINIISKGKIEMVKPSYFVWEVLVPGKLKFVYNQGHLKLIENKNVVMDIKKGSVAKEATIMVEFLKSWLSMDKTYILQNFKIIKLGHNIFRFISISKHKIFKEITLKIINKNKISEMIMTELSGDQITLNFLKHVNKYEK